MSFRPRAASPSAGQDQLPLDLSLTGLDACANQDGVDATRTGYQLQSWHLPAAQRTNSCRRRGPVLRQSAYDEAEGWVPMEDGPAPRVWRPRATAVEAVAKCMRWTGFSGYPSMQVVDLATGTVVWRDSRHDPDAGPSIDLPDDLNRVACAAARATRATPRRRDATELIIQPRLW